MNITTAVLDPAIWLAADGILDWITDKNTEAIAAFRAMAVLAAIIFVFMAAIKSGGAMARIIIAGLAAAIFVWIVFNITDLKNRVDNEVKSAPAVTQQLSHLPGVTL